MQNIAFTTGGTGGHIYPAIALSKKLREENKNIIFIGTKHRMEKEIVPANNFKFYGLDILPLNRITNIFKAFIAIFKARKILKENEIDTIIGFGNYISIPNIIAAKTLGIDIYLQEQNIIMGSANKFLSRFAKKIFLAFEGSKKYVRKADLSKCYVTGNPLREEFYNISKEMARENLKISNDDKVILVMGGSLGAKQINDAVIKNVESINKAKNLRVFFSTGKNLFDEVHSKIKNLDNIILMPYFENVYEIMAASDIVICRAGASTISELIELEKPSILLPYDFVGQNENAQMLEYINATKVYTNEEANEAVKEALSLCSQEEILMFMKENIKKVNTGNAVKNIIELMDSEK